MSSKTEALVPVGGAVTTTREFGGNELEMRGDLASIAAAARAKAEVEASIVQAIKRPRSLRQFRQQMMEECAYPTFANIALYSKPVGKDKDGKQTFAVDFSVRFIEMAIQLFKNMSTRTYISYEDASKVIVAVKVVDLENNTFHEREAIVEKLVERRYLPKGRKERGQRENTYGDVVFLLDATSDEVVNKIGIAASKLLRDNAKRLLPRHILDECREAVEKTIADRDAANPDEAKNDLTDAFFKKGVTVENLESYLGHALDTLSPKELSELRAIFVGLRDEEFTWQDIVRMRGEEAEGDANEDSKPSPKAQALRDKLSAAAAKTKRTDQQAAATEEPKG